MRQQPGTPISTCNRKPTVFVVSNVGLVSEGVSLQLGRFDRIVLSGSGPLESRTIGGIERENCDVVVLDFACSGSHGFARDLIGRLPGIRIVGIAIGSTSLPVADWAELGVVGFVDDTGSIEDLVSAVLRVARGDYALSRETTNDLVSGLIDRCERRRIPEGAQKLTPRETQILTDLERGATNKEIARRLGISAHTVKNHVHHILEKLDVRRRDDAGRFARNARY